MLIQGKLVQNVTVEIDEMEQKNIVNRYLRQKFNLPMFCHICDLYIDEKNRLVQVEEESYGKEKTVILRVATEKDKLILSVLKEI